MQDNNTDEMISQIEVTIEQAKEDLALHTDLVKLIANESFKNIISKGYFEDESSRVVMAKSMPEMQSKELQANLDNVIIGIGQLRQYFAKISKMAQMSEKAIIDAEAAREEILLEAAQ